MAVARLLAMSHRVKACGFLLAAVGVLTMLILTWVPTLEGSRTAPPRDQKTAGGDVDDN
jgi:hypothetical protein